MSFYETAHARTKDLHYEGPNRYGAHITIDAAELSPDRFEVVVLRSDGLEIADVKVNGLEAAEKAYRDFVRMYVRPAAEEKPLAGKYAQLRDDLKRALKVGRAVEDETLDDDGGACNFDSPSLRLPRWNEKQVKQAAKEAGTGCFVWNFYGSKRFVFTPDTRAQGNARSRNAEAVTKELRRMGYDALDYCQMD